MASGRLKTIAVLVATMKFYYLRISWPSELSAKRLEITLNSLEVLRVDFMDDLRPPRVHGANAPLIMTRPQQAAIMRLENLIVYSCQLGLCRWISLVSRLEAF